MTVPPRYQPLMMVLGIPVTALLTVSAAIALRPLSFWIFSAAAIFAAVVGLLTRSPGILMSSAVLAAPLFFYVGSLPLFWPWAWTVPAFMAGGALIVRRRRWLSVLSVLPLLVASVWLAA